MERKEEDSNISSADAAVDEHQQFLQTLEQQTNWDGRSLRRYHDVWCPERILRPILSSQNNFKAKSTDIILATVPKSGTTWLKALTFSIVNRNLYSEIDQSPLLTSNPHELVPFLEFVIFREQENPNLESIPSPRMFATHVPLKILPTSILDQSESKIIYICRNPLDQFISHRQFLIENKLEKDFSPLSLEESFDMFCDGIHPFGPFWDHMLGYWRAHLKNPEKVLFLKYEDLKEDICFNVKKIGEFIGFPFSEEEEKAGMVEKISKICSFETLSNLEVNKSGILGNGIIKSSSMFRKGEVGDWANYLTPEMAERMKKIMESKFEGSGLFFKI